VNKVALETVENVKVNKPMQQVSEIRNEEPSIISGTSATIWSKLTLGVLATITFEVVPFHVYALFPTLLPFS
jgi:hypothetical protein